MIKSNPIIIKMQVKCDGMFEHNHEFEVTHSKSVLLEQLIELFEKSPEAESDGAMGG